MHFLTNCFSMVRVTSTDSYRDGTFDACEMTTPTTTASTTVTTTATTSQTTSQTTSATTTPTTTPSTTPTTTTTTTVTSTATSSRTTSPTTTETTTPTSTFTTTPTTTPITTPTTSSTTTPTTTRTITPTTSASTTPTTTTTTTGTTTETSTPITTRTTSATTTDSQGRFTCARHVGVWYVAPDSDASAVRQLYLLNQLIYECHRDLLLALAADIGGPDAQQELAMLSVDTLATGLIILLANPDVNDVLFQLKTAADYINGVVSEYTVNDISAGLTEDMSGYIKAATETECMTAVGYINAAMTAYLYEGFGQCARSTATTTQTTSETTTPTTTSAGPTASPTPSPTGAPSSSTPTAAPSDGPTGEPTRLPSATPTVEPASSSPSGQPSAQPTRDPTHGPSERPSAIPTGTPTAFPSWYPTAAQDFYFKANVTMSMDFGMWSQFKHDRLVALLASYVQIRQRQIRIEAVIPGSTVAMIEFGAFSSIRAATNAQLRLQSFTSDAAFQQEYGTIRLAVGLIFEKGSTTTSAAPDLAAASLEEAGLDTWVITVIIVAVVILLLALVILTIISCRQSHAQREMTTQLSQAVLGNRAFANTFSNDMSPAQSYNGMDPVTGLATYYPSPLNGPDFFAADAPSETTRGSLNRDNEVSLRFYILRWRMLFVLLGQCAPSLSREAVTD